MINYSMDLLTTIHQSIQPPNSGDTFCCKGKYEYWHYGCDGNNDQGWGCGYRTLQTIASWIIKNKNSSLTVPSIREIQETLVSLEDKEQNFIGSKEWIGSFEVCLVMDALYDVPCKMVHIPYANFIKHKNIFIDHFEKYCCPIMMGGDKDCSSKGIVGVHATKNEMYLLVVDPHFIGRAKSAQQLIDNGYLLWKNVLDLSQDSFYNVCFPQIKYTER